MLEEERTYQVEGGFILPDLSECVPADGRLIVRPPQRLRATYFDTTDLRLARGGASLRYRRGDDEPWTVAVPTGRSGVRTETSAGGSPSAVPERFLDLLTVYTRGAPVAPVATLSTARQAYQLCDREDRVAVEVVDDTVSVVEGRRVALRFRVVDVERRAGKAKLLDRVEAALRDAGATASEFTPKQIRALGLTALEPPDWPCPPARLPKRPTIAEVVTASIQRDIGRIICHDPLVRLRSPVVADDSPLHQMRVGVRRLRDDLRTFAAILDRDWATRRRAELGWLAKALGAAREAEILRGRLRRTAAADPLDPLDAAAVARIDADLAARHEETLQALDKVLGSDAYLQLVDSLHQAAHQPGLGGRAYEPAESVMPELVRRSWQRLAFGHNGGVGAGALGLDSDDAAWHTVRVRCKRARHAAEAAASVLGGDVAELTSALTAVQQLLGEHQDAMAAARTWLTIANSDPDDYGLAVTAGRLYERERAAVRSARDSFPAAWKLASKRRLTHWLR